MQEILEGRERERERNWNVLIPLEEKGEQISVYYHHTKMQND